MPLKASLPTKQAEELAPARATTGQKPDILHKRREADVLPDWTPTHADLEGCRWLVSFLGLSLYKESPGPSAYLLAGILKAEAGRDL